ncbi:uncharacterized protein BO80DRAFT_446396 [Aspergillus ibericus CBS 121593]|uniref:Uncharacterized protein n=1 Tax=Aspergillus ibericus CBS 121593 TaxID=1448316 RepID=A0A395GXJ7_9EURO|nr:hypothetical protein BO80DRAFT_446396 [Aspergillus ibericus CBS 121593]RAK99417.1 hypothetical protein BO80DRAFT_446396 [Aspergillus ibericus CBS 121593]
MRPDAWRPGRSRLFMPQDFSSCTVDPPGLLCKVRMRYPRDWDKLGPTRADAECPDQVNVFRRTRAIGGGVDARLRRDALVSGSHEAGCSIPCLAVTLFIALLPTACLLDPERGRGAPILAKPLDPTCAGPDGELVLQARRLVNLGRARADADWQAGLGLGPEWREGRQADELGLHPENTMHGRRSSRQTGIRRGY